MTCIAIDDEPPALAILHNYIGRDARLKLLGTFDDAINGREFLLRNPVDLLFIDIDMPDLTGLELVRNLPIRPLIIFTTAYKNYAVEGFELDAIDYLLKPFTLKRFQHAIDKAYEYHNYRNTTPPTTQNEHLFVYSEYRLIKIPHHEIVYIESLEDYIRIHLHQGKPVLTLLSLKKALEQLPHTQFRRIHRSYAVSLSKIKWIQNRRLKLITDTELPIGQSYQQFVDDWKS